MTRRARVVPALALAILALGALAASAVARPGSVSLQKLDSHLIQIRGGDDAAISAARAQDLTVSRAERVLADVYVTGDLTDAAGALDREGMVIAATGGQPVQALEGWIPVESLGEVARLATTSAVIPVAGGGTDTGSRTSQGVVAHHVPQAQVGPPATTGAGVDVGVISDSINQVAGGISNSQATGDLPADTTSMLDLPGGLDEGRAMAEIIYDEAPGISSVKFSSGSLGPFAKAASIDNLVTAGADLIADDVFYLGEPMFQDGVVAKAVDRAKAAGVPYFASAGNRARQSYERVYSDDGTGSHDFDPGPGVDILDSFTANIPASTIANPDPTLELALQWDEPWGTAVTDLDLTIRDTSDNSILASSTTDNLGTGIPLEFASYVNSTAAPVNVGVMIKRTAGARSPFMKWIESDNFSAIPIPEFNTASDTINPDAASAKGAFAVAAVSAIDPGNDSPETYSSRGPTTRLFDADGLRLAAPSVLATPRAAAADAVTTTLAKFSPFTGTSAAAPSMAGIAALLISANPRASVDEIYGVLADPANAIDCTPTPGAPDADCGVGFTLADRALASLDLTGPVLTAVTTPRRANGRNGWFRKNVSLTWTVSDAESSLESGPCAGGTRTKDGKARFTCAVRSGGGLTSRTVVIKRDTVKPSKPRLKGFEGRVFEPGELPGIRKLRCRSKDRTSGIGSCRIKGLKRKPGRHTLVATATDRAGLKRVTKIRYRVIRG